LFFLKVFLINSLNFNLKISNLIDIGLQESFKLFIQNFIHVLLNIVWEYFEIFCHLSIFWIVWFYFFFKLRQHINFSLYNYFFRLFFIILNLNWHLRLHHVLNIISLYILKTARLALIFLKFPIYRDCQILFLSIVQIISRKSFIRKLGHPCHFCKHLFRLLFNHDIFDSFKNLSSYSIIKLIEFRSL